MLRKLKKTIPAVISAILCVTMILGVTVSAADDENVFGETLALTAMKYNKTSVNWLKKYSKKESDSKISYSKSRTKKFLDKLAKTAEDNEADFALGLMTNDSLLYFASKDNNKLKIISYVEDKATAMYIANDKLTLLDPQNKTKIETGTEDFSAGGYSEIVAENFDFDIPENLKGKIFKLKSGEKIYYYEEFECDEYDRVGFIFTEKGTPIAMLVKNEYYCIKFSTSVKNSEFEIPKGYKDADFGAFE